MIFFVRSKSLVLQVFPFQREHGWIPTPTLSVFDEWGTRFKVAIIG